MSKEERELVRIAEEAGEAPTLRALRQALTDLGCCVTAFRKMEIGTEQTPVHLRRQDAERALSRVDAALRLAARLDAPESAAVVVTAAAEALVRREGKVLTVDADENGLRLDTTDTEMGAVRAKGVRDVMYREQGAIQHVR